MSSIWFKPIDLETGNKMMKNTIMEHLEIKIESIDQESIVGSMPVDHRHHQPYGILHGGASVVLAETLGSMAAHLTVDPSKYQTVGLEVKANHIRPKKDGYVTGKAIPLHLGKGTQVWEIEIKDEQDRLVCLSRLTVAVINKRL